MDLADCASFHTLIFKKGVTNLIYRSFFYLTPGRRMKLTLFRLLMHSIYGIQSFLDNMCRKELFIHSATSTMTGKSYYLKIVITSSNRSLRHAFCSFSATFSIQQCSVSLKKWKIDTWYNLKKNLR